MGRPPRAGVIALPERIEGDGLVLRRWSVEDAALMVRAVEESAEHLRPWVTWVDEEPANVEGRRAWLEACERDWRAGGPVFLAILEADAVAGGASIAPTGEPGVLELGFWLHPSFTGRGIATRAARLLTETALAQPDCREVLIRHDRANARSGGVPARLGFRRAGEEPNPRPAPADEGIDLVWRC